MLPHSICRTVLTQIVAAAPGVISLTTNTASPGHTAPTHPKHIVGAITSASHRHAVAASTLNINRRAARDREGRPQLGPAMSRNISANDRRMRIALAAHARWHDGPPVT